MFDMKRYEDLILAAAKVFDRHNSEIAKHLAEILSTIKPRLAVKTQVLCFGNPDLPIALERDESDLGKAVATCAPHLWWRPPGFGKTTGTVAQDIAVVELIGPNGMIFNDRCRFGLLLQQANTKYPKHSHAAEELYFIISGTAKWGVDNNAPQAHGPGSFIHHLPFQPHAMTTEENPMLSMWGWVGDISSSSYSIPMSE